MFWLRDLMIANPAVSILVVPLVAVLLIGALSRGISDSSKWALIGGLAYLGFLIPLGPALLRHGKIPPPNVPWYIYAVFAGMGAIVGLFIWSLKESDKPAEPRW